MTFAQLKRKSKTAVEALKEKVSQTNQKQSYDDDRYWTLKRNPKTDTGQAIIRFLPVSPADMEKELVTPWVEFAEYNFYITGPTGNKMWYIEKSLKSIGKEDPVWEFNGELWDSGLETKKEQARRQRQNKKYVANILVIKDPINPENNGKIKLFKFGPAIYQMIKDRLIKPEETAEFEDVLGDEDAKDEAEFVSVDVTDIFEGCEFQIRIHKKSDGFYTYAKSTWGPSKPLAKSEKAMEALWKDEFCLSEIVAEDQFKTYEELKARLDKMRFGTPQIPQSSQPTAKVVDATTPPMAPSPAGETADLSEGAIKEFFEMAEKTDAANPADDIPF
jgi:hypothetical protein